MRQVFNYNRFNDEVADGIVETFGVLVNASMEGKNDTADYQEANAKLNETFMRFCVEAIPGRSFNSMEDIKNPMIHNDAFFVQRFNTILAQAITPIVPAVISNNYGQLYDVHQTGWGTLYSYPVC